MDSFDYDLQKISDVIKSHKNLRNFSFKMSRAAVKSAENIQNLVDSFHNSKSLKNISLDDGRTSFECHENNLVEPFYSFWSSEIIENEVKTFEMICRKIQSLKTIHFRLIKAKQPDLHLERIMKSIHFASELKELFIELDDFDKISDDEVAKILELKPLKFLEKLNININFCPRLTDKTLTFLSFSLANLFQLKRLILRFLDTTMTSKGILALAFVIRNLRNLEEITLDFIWATEIDDLGLVEIGNSLKFLKRLKILSLNFGTFTEKSSGKFTKKSLLKICEAFQYLSFLEDLTFKFPSKCDFDDKLLCEISLSLVNLIRLKNLEICLVGSSKISSVGLIALTNVLMNMIRLENLTLSFGRNEYIDIEGLKALLLGYIYENLRSKFVYENLGLKYVKLNFIKCSNIDLNNLQNLVFGHIFNKTIILTSENILLIKFDKDK